MARKKKASETTEFAVAILTDALAHVKAGDTLEDALRNASIRMEEAWMREDNPGVDPNGD